MGTKTSNYQLNQWEPEDDFLRTDFNEDNAKIDAAMAGFGNCKVASGSYVGKGTYGASNPTRLTFSFEPKIVFVWQDGAAYAPVSIDSTYTRSGRWTPLFVILLRGASKVYCADVNVNPVENTLTFSGNTVSVYNTSSDFTQWNSSGKTYHYVAIG